MAMLRLSGQHRYAMVLAVIAIAILVLGLALKPSPSNAQRKRADVNATRAELENLQRLVQRNSLRNMGSQFSSVADKASESLLPLANSNRNAIAWSDTTILIAKRMGETPRIVPAIANNGQPQSAAPGQWIAGMPVAVAQIASNSATVPATNTQPAQGAWIVGVSARVGSAPVFRPGVYNGTTTAACGPFVQQKVLTTVALSPEMLGGGLFDLETHLVGVIVECDEGLAIIPTEEIRRAMLRSANSEMLGRYGMRVTTATPAWNLGQPPPATVVVSEVWRAWPADSAGLDPGDFIEQIDSQPCTSVDLARSLLSSTGEHQVKLRRRSRVVNVKIQPAFVDVNPAISQGVLLEEPAAGLAIEHVTVGSSADKAGIRAGDRVLAVDGQTATRTSVQDAIGPFHVNSPVLVQVQRGDRRIGVVLEP